MGFSANQIEVHNTPQQLEGYQGDKRQDSAEIILPRRAVGGASNDIGFKLQEDGTFGAIISEYDRGNGCSNKGKYSAGIRGYNQQWLDKLAQRYAYHKVKSELATQGYYLETESEKAGELYLEITTPFGG